MPDFAQRRTMMVDTQVRPNDVTKFPIIEAMLTIPREAFVPAPRVEAAYMGENIALPSGRVMLEPRTLAKMLDALDIAPDDHVLLLGAGLGYTAAVIARMAGSVVAVEDDAGMAVEARARLAAAGAGDVLIVQGPLTAGAPDSAPFDAVLIEGGVETVPEALLAQLKDGGRIGAFYMEGALGTARVGHKSNGQVAWRFAFNAAAPVMAGFVRARGFAL